MIGEEMLGVRSAGKGLQSEVGGGLKDRRKWGERTPRVFSCWMGMIPGKFVVVE